MWPFRTPDTTKRSKVKHQPSRNRTDPPSTKSSSHSSSESQPTLESNMRSLPLRSNQGRSHDYRSTVSSANTSFDEDKQRLRNILRGAAAASSQAPPSKPDEDGKKALFRRVMARANVFEKKTDSSIVAASSTSSLGSQHSKSSYSGRSVEHQVSAHTKSEKQSSPRETDSQLSTSVVEDKTLPVVKESEERPASTRLVDRLDANPAASDFRTRLRKANQRVESSPPRQTTSFLDEKTREMIQEKMRQRRAPLSGGVSAKMSTQEKEETKLPENGNDDDDEDPDLEGYDTFFQTLKDEVHGQHSLLWASFSAVMRHERPPQLEAVPPSKGFRFDKRTKEMLTMMNAYLQEKPNVLHNATTQLVNDKKFSKELKKSHKIGIDEVGRQPKNLQPFDTVGKKDNPIDLVPTASTSTSASTRDQDRYMVATAETASQPSTSAAVAESVMYENASNPGVEVTLGQFELKYEQKTQPETPSDVSSAPLWSNVQLKSVKQTNSDNLRSKTPNFAKVQLRKISPPAEAKQLKVITLEDELPQTNPLPASSQPDESPTVKATEGEEKKEVGPSEDVKALPAPQPTEKNDQGDTDRNQKPTETGMEESSRSKNKDHSRRKIDEAVYVNLKADLDTENGDQNKVIIGRKNIMIVRAKKGDNQADVVWKLPRTDAASLTIDMTQLIVKVISLEGSTLREMRFETSGDCLKFANAFYEKLALESSFQDLPSKPKAQFPPAVIEAADDDGDTEFAAVRLERLNDEERAVLDTYRRLRRSKPPKDALTESIATEKEMGPSKEEALTAEEDGVATKFRKMLKMKIPLEAVKHAMEKDSVNKKIVDAVLAEVQGIPQDVATGDLPSSPVSTFSHSVGLSESDASIVEKYKKMLKMRIPADAIRHEMNKKGVEPRLFDYVFEDANNENANDQSREKSGSPSLSPADEAVAAHYRKLISRGVPKESVRHGMAKEKVASHIIAAVLGDRTESNNASVVTAAAKNQKENDLTLEEEKIASQFKKLLKRQIPRQQILDRMKKEGVNEKVMVAVLGKRGLSVSTSDDPSQRKGNSSKFVQIHWTPLSGSQLDNSIFNRTKKRTTEVSAPEGNAFMKLKELFEKKTTKNVHKDRLASHGSDGPDKAKLLDLGRSNNVAISLKAFKEYSYSDLANIIQYLDPLHKLQGERVHFLRDLLPTISETKLMQSYDGPESRLEPAELWFRSIVGIKRIEAKVHALRTMEMLEIESRSIGENLRLLTRVCNQVMDSEKLQDLLVMVLQVGNIMNEGTRTGGAAGFKLDSLLKLTQTKSADGKTTVLDYLVEDVFIAKGDRDKLDLNSDFPDCSLASRMLIGDLVAEVKAMQDSVTQCNEELDALRKEVEKKHGGLGGAIAHFESQDKQNIYGAIERLESFVAVAQGIVEKLIKEKDEALTVSRELCMYCGEGSGSAAATSLLGVLSEFATNIESAVRKSDEKRKARERRQKRQADESSTKSAESKGAVEHSGSKESLVLLVNKMMKDANSRTLEDFKKGRVIENPSNLMQTIYEKEHTLAQSNERQRASLATAIQSKCEDLDEGEFLKARTKFGSPRANLREKKAASHNESINLSESFPQRHTPPRPWSPPLQREAEVSSPHSSAFVSEASEDVSLITDTSTMISSCVDEQVENNEKFFRRPAHRPTPEGLPLRPNSVSNLDSTSNSEKDQSSKRHHNARPTPESFVRENGPDKIKPTKPTPECDFRATTQENKFIKDGGASALGSSVEVADDALATTKSLSSISTQTYKAKAIETQQPSEITSFDKSTANDVSQPTEGFPNQSEQEPLSDSETAEESITTNGSHENTNESNGERERVTTEADTEHLVDPYSKGHLHAGLLDDEHAQKLQAAEDRISALRARAKVALAEASAETSDTNSNHAKTLPDSQESATEGNAKAPPKQGRVAALAAGFLKQGADSAKPIQPGQSHFVQSPSLGKNTCLVPKSSAKQDDQPNTTTKESISTDRSPIVPLSASVEDSESLLSPGFLKTDSRVLNVHNSSIEFAANADPRPDPPSFLKRSTASNSDSRPDPPTPTTERTDLTNGEFQAGMTLSSDSKCDPESKLNDDAPTSASNDETRVQIMEDGSKVAESSRVAANIDNLAYELGKNTPLEETPRADGVSNNLFDISAARNRLAIRKSMDANPPATVTKSPAYLGLTVAKSSSEAERSNASSSKKPTKSLQELAMLKREKRSIGRSPVRDAGTSIQSPEINEELPSLSGYLALARQRRDSRGSIGGSISSPPMNASAFRLSSPGQPPATAVKKGVTTKGPPGESSFARMAREKRAARKGA